MSRIYVAGKFEDIERVRAVQDVLKGAGHTITFDWTRDEDGFTAVQAMRDMRGVLTADALVFVAYEDLGFRGSYVEFGMALMRGIPIYLIGTGADRCLFTTLPQVHRGIEDLLVLSSLQAQRHLAIDGGKLRLDVQKTQV